MEQELRTVEAAIESDKQAEAGLSRNIHEAELELVNREKDGAALKDELGRAEQRAQTLENESAGRAAQKTSSPGEMEKSSAVLRGLEAGQNNAQANIEALQRELAAEKGVLEKARAEITEVKLEVAALQEKQAAAAKGLAALSGAETDLADRLAKREAELAGIASKVRELEASISAAEAEIKGHIAALEGRRQVLTAKQEAHEEKGRALHALEEEGPGAA